MTNSSEEVLADRRNSLLQDLFDRREWLLVALFCLLAAARVSAFTLAYPFFNNVDEQYHFDLVCKYSRGDIPHGAEPFSAEAATFMALYHSPEYCWRLEDYPTKETPPPVWGFPRRNKPAFCRNSRRDSGRNRISNPPKCLCIMRW